MSDHAPVIVWFRQDLRIHDNPALIAAAQTNAPIILLYIFEDIEHPWKIGGASRWWLHHSLENLQKSLGQRYQAKLYMAQGHADLILNQLIRSTGANQIYWNRCYEPQNIIRDQAIKKTLRDQNITAHSFNGSLLKEPWEVKNLSKLPFKVFTPFWKTLQQMEIRAVHPAPKTLNLYKIIQTDMLFLEIKQLELLPSIYWYQGLEQAWVVGEEGALDKLNYFLRQHLANYKENRNHPSLDATSRLSPHLHFGEISPVQIWHAAKQYQQQHHQQISESDMLHFLSEVSWREFSYQLLYQFPELPNRAFKPNFDKFPWQPNESHVKLWQQGQTGYPIIDAGMRELYATGFMHNRVRMIVASFLIKHLLQPWQVGEAWFWDTLVDADLANNAASWQWVAGSGADAAPYFRIFNPILQSKKFDPEGIYIKKWVPELAELDIKYLHAPWEANITIASYPKPIIDHEFGRKRALEAYQNL